MGEGIMGSDRCEWTSIHNFFDSREMARPSWTSNASRLATRTTLIPDDLSKRSCFEDSLAVNRGRMIHCSSTQALPLPNFSVMSPLMKYGRVYCRLLAILE
jgi:hypothetical protein